MAIAMDVAGYILWECPDTTDDLLIMSKELEVWEDEIIGDTVHEFVKVNK